MEHTKKPSRAKEVLSNTLSLVLSIALVGGIWWLFKYIKEPTPEQECRTMLTGERPDPRAGYSDPRKIFELGCDTMQEFQKIREELRLCIYRR